MSTNPFAVLTIEDEPQQKKNQQKNQQPKKTPAERKQNREKLQNIKPKETKITTVVVDDVGFQQVPGAKEKGPKRLNKEEYLKEVSLGNNPIQTLETTTSNPARGEFRTRGTKQKNRGRITGTDEDVNAKNLNRPDFIPGGKRFNDDKQPRKGGNNNRGGKNNNQKKGGNNNNRGRVYDKKSGTGLDNAPKKSESGGNNWGDPIKEQLEEVKAPAVEEYYPEPDEDGEPKKDDVVRKGYHTFVQKLEEEKGKVNQLLEKHQLDKKQANVPKVVEPTNVQNINKKHVSELVIESSKDSLFIKQSTTPVTNIEIKPAENKPVVDNKPKKQVIPSSQLNFKNKRHRGINVPLEELPQRQKRDQQNQGQNSPNQGTNQNQTNSPNQGTNQNQTNDNKNTTNQNQVQNSPNQGTNQNQTNSPNQGKSPNQNRTNNYSKGSPNTKRNNNNKFKNSGQKKFINQDEFPTLNDEKVVIEKPLWVTNN